MSKKYYKINNLIPLYSEDLIRLGRKKDGGYIVNNRLVSKTQYLISFGISTNWSFESDFKKMKSDLEIHAFDFSVDSLSFIKESLKSFTSIFKFNKKSIRNFLLVFHYILVSLKFSLFFRAKRKIFFYKKGIEHEANQLFYTFDNIFDLLKNKNISENTLFIKMDIEGSEFNVLLDMLKYSKLINGVVVEFHDLNQYSDKFKEIIAEMTENGFIISHIHANNGGGYIENTKLPILLELTFIKKEFFNESELQKVNNIIYPIENLDYPCVKELRELKIDFN